VAVATPYDADLAKVNAELASKTLYAGKKEARAENKARAAQMAELAPEAAAERIQFLKTTRGAGKGSGAAASVSSAPTAVGGAVDLAAQPEALASVKDEELPQELQGLDAAAREKKVKQLADERKALEEKAAKLSAERDAWRTKNVADKEDSFDANVMKGVKEKAAKHGLTY
jgi:hypothetical protein